MIPGLLETFDKLKELHIKKNQDYTGKSGNPFFNFDVAESVSSLFDKNEDKTYAVMIGIKIGRIAALLNSGKEPNHESLLDSFDDLIVYAAIWKADIERRMEREELLKEVKASGPASVDNPKGLNTDTF